MWIKKTGRLLILIIAKTTLTTEKQLEDAYVSHCQTSLCIKFSL